MSDVKSQPPQSGEAFVSYIEELDSGGRAVLRRSLAFDPGTWPPAFKYVESWIGAEAGAWERRVTYLVAGLQALSKADRYYDDVGAAARALSAATASQSVESRFLSLLDADSEQLPHRLRQMIDLMSSQGIAPAWAGLRRDVLRWGTEDRWVQQRWARSYYSVQDEAAKQRGAADSDGSAPAGRNPISEGGKELL